MKIRPLGDRIVIKQFEAEETTKSGIILTAQTKEKPPIFEVIEVPEVDGDAKVILKVGDKVVCNKFSGLSCNIDGQEYTIIHQSDILGVIED